MDIFFRFLCNRLQYEVLKMYTISAIFKKSSLSSATVNRGLNKIQAVNKDIRKLDYQQD
jgi:hypothetical protein